MIPRKAPLKRSSKPIARTAVKKVRAKPRPGRLKGKALTALRESVFERDGFRCQHLLPAHITDHGQVISELWEPCNLLLTSRTAHLAHIRNKRMWGDSMENCTTKCAEHHLVNEHSYGPSGIKPVPPKEKPCEP